MGLLKDLKDAFLITTCGKLFWLALKGWRCPRCNYPIDNNDKKCPHCKQPLDWKGVNKSKSM